MLKIALLILATSIWGLGFVASRWTFIEYSPIWSHALRFLFAAILALPLFFFRRKIKNLWAGIFCGFLMTMGLLVQTIGIAQTTLAKSGFLTVFYAIFTPILSLILYKSKFRKTYWALVALAIVGIAFLCELEFKNFNQGDAIILLSALLFSFHILAVDKYAQQEKSLDFNFFQCVVGGIFAVGFAYIYEGPVSLKPLLNYQNLFVPSALWGFIILSLFSSLLAFTIQVYAQKGTPPHIVSLVFLMESVFAAFFGFYFFDEKFSPLALMGAFLVLVSVALIPIATRYKKSS